MYLMDQNKIARGTDLSFGLNKIIPINGPPGDHVMMPIRHIFRDMLWGNWPIGNVRRMDAC